MRGRKFNITGRITSPISDSPVYQPVNPIPDWYLPVNIIRSKAMCSLSGIRTEIPEHTGRSSRHEISAPGRNTALSRVLKVPNRNLQTPQELHPPLADIRQIERCAAMMRTSFQHGEKSVIPGNTFQSAEANTALGRRRRVAITTSAGAIPAFKPGMTSNR